MDSYDKMQREVDFIFRNPEQYAALPKRRKAMLRLWHHPAFGQRSAWSLHPDWGSAPKGKSSLVLRRVVAWEAGATPSQLYVSEARPDRKKIKEIFGRMHQITLPPFLSRDSDRGRDGSTYGVMLGNTLDYSELGWWREAPASWQPLVTWFDETTVYFESILPARSNPNS